MTVDAGPGPLSLRGTHSRALSRHRHAPASLEQEPRHSLRTDRGYSQADLPFVFSHMRPSQEMGGLAQCQVNRVPQAPFSHTKRADRELDWARPKVVPVPLVPSLDIRAPSSSLTGQTLAFLGLCKMLGCVEVLKYIFCTLWRECVCVAGAPVRAADRGWPVSNIPELGTRGPVLQERPAHAPVGPISHPRR